MDKKMATKIEQALVLIGADKEHTIYEDKLFAKYAPIYSFTSENLKGCFSHFNFQDKRVLTVCGSGDQILNAILLGAKSVDAFDVNELSEMFYYLKEAAIKALSYEEFLEYFYYTPKYPPNKEMNIKSYWKLSPYLKDQARIFWDNLYLEANGSEIRASKLFHTILSYGLNEKEMITLINNYLDRDSYYELKNKINNCEMNFIAIDIKYLKHKINKKYDFIFLSNIAQYVKNDSNNNLKPNIQELHKFKDLTMELTNFLNAEGVLAIAYLYNYSINENIDNPNWAMIKRPQIRMSVFPHDQYKYVDFPALIALNNFTKYDILTKEKDAVLVYQKEKSIEY